ncbi:TauD/TfdA family dioxygenase [Bradyrhizobium yuanmingense]|uniref:TauD/TfdA dioxygenase family protein n=1 Tax=Bradyrhizobium yuanmingense TaxID=108015 RepID=UPI0023BA3058|nr:TauD/TfdA family dioxygenase [Bradyrhizobium yuanmingense]MDF0523252.1 TauD/TfdA family dioxygenase [Bradyrhizobium yuanmingense]
MSEVAIIDTGVPQIEVVRRAARIGAEIRNIKVSGDLPDQIIAAIKRLLFEYKVIFFRDQSQLDDAEHERFAARLGKVVPHPLASIKGTTKLELDSSRGGSRADTWHADATFLDAYFKILVLRSVLIPQFGGDTIWSNTVAAYLDLPPPLQGLADQLWAIHSNAFDHAGMARAREVDRKHYQEVYTKTIFEAEHPVVRVHPETGERALVLGCWAQRFIDIPKYDGQRLFDLFQSHIAAPENTTRWSWKQGDVVIWDNRVTHHYAVNDYDDQRRIVRRFAVDFDVPISVDGRRSVNRLKNNTGPPIEVA